MCFYINSIGCYQISGRKRHHETFNQLKNKAICFAFINIKSGANIENRKHEKPTLLPNIVKALCFLLCFKRMDYSNVISSISLYFA